jgi:hypothetical protein
MENTSKFPVQTLLKAKQMVRKDDLPTRYNLCVSTGMDS